MRILITSMLALCLALPAVVAAQGTPASATGAKPNAGKPFTTTGCLRQQMDGIKTDVRMLIRVHDTGKGQGSVPIFAHSIEINLLLIGQRNCDVTNMDAINALNAVTAPLREGALALKRNPADLSVVPAMRAAVERYERLFYDELRQDGPSPTKF